MKISSFLFAAFGLFYVVAAGLYMGFADDATGFTMLVVLAVFTVTFALYLYAALRSGGEAMPEDRADADMADGAGRVLYFPSSSIWPLVLAIGIGAIGLGLIVGLWWSVLGIGLFSLGIVGYTRESSLAASRHSDPGNEQA